jgi:hypothetical protein
MGSKMWLVRLISRYESAQFAIRLSARAETGGGFNLVLTDETPRGSMQGSVELITRSKIHHQTLPRGALCSIENLVLQSGVLELAEQEPQGPLIIDGMEFFMLDGTHYEIEIYWHGRHKTVRRFEKPEIHFATLFNAVLPIALKDSPLLNQALKFKCFPM